MAGIEPTGSMLFIELNDWQFSVRNAQGATLAADCAAAALTKSGLVFGRAALATARSEPQRFNNRYLTSVSADPLGTDMGIARNSADLLYHHLTSLDLPADPALVAIPGHYSHEQLGLLLGIMNEASINVCGFVDTPLAHVLNLALPTRYRLLDIEWHRFSLTELECVGGEHHIRSTTSLEHIGGVAALVERWMNVIADDFIKKTRFDPLHNGATEQMVYDQVSGWLEQRVLKDQRITLSQTGTIREHEVSASLLKNRLAEQLQQLELGSPDEPLILTHRLANIPGVLDCFTEQGFTTAQSVADEVLLNLVSLSSATRAEGITRITSAAAMPDKRTVEPQASATQTPPPAQEPPPEVKPSASAETKAATHLLERYRAWRIGDARFADYFDQSGCISHTTVSLNGAAAIGAQPAPGDDVKIDGQRYIAIRVD